MVILRQPESLCHPWEVVRKTEMTATDSFWHAFTPTCKTEGRSTVWADNNVRRMGFKVKLIFENILLAIAA